MRGVAYVFHVFELPQTRRLGVAALMFVLGFAAGNSHRTEVALQGQAVYFQKADVRHVQAVAAKVAAGVRKEDAAAVGVAPEVLKATVDAAKQ